MTTKTITEAQLLLAVINGTGIYQSPDDGSIHVDNADDVPTFAAAIFAALPDTGLEQPCRHCGSAEHRRVYARLTEEER